MASPKLMKLMKYLLPLLVCVFQPAISATVTSITPNEGSVAGGTRLTISGNGFSADRFSFGRGNEHKGNVVYLRNEYTTHSCDVIPYYCNQEQIVCDTRALGYEDTFNVFVIVDGDTETTCNKQQNCRFAFSKNQSPTIEKVTPISGEPGTTLSIRGKIFTDVYDPTPKQEEEDVTKDDQILRIYWGNYACDPLDPATDELYNIALDSAESYWGIIECRPKGTYVASQNVAYLISGNYGRSFSERNSLHVSSQNELYHFQTHADILNVEPNIGSANGGTDLTITGKFFDGYSISVLVGGVPCGISNVTSTEIKCVTGSAPPVVMLYPGERGMLYEVWTDTYKQLNSASWDTTAPDYNSTWVLEASSPNKHQLGEDNRFMGRLSGFFSPPRTGQYQFKIISDDESKLYFSLSGDPDNKTEIAYLNRFSNNWNDYPDQVSETILLEANQSYYLEAVYRDNSGTDYVKIGVVFFDIPLSNADISSATNEVQRIRTTSVVRSELQTLTVGGSVYEEQTVVINPSTCSSGDSCSYKLKFGEKVTGDLSMTATADEMQSSLNTIISPDVVTVTMETAVDKTTYTITFQMVQNNIPLLAVVKDDPSLSITVSRTVAFSPVELDKFNIVVDGVVSVDLSSSSSAKEVEDTLLNMFSVQCQTIGQDSSFYVQDFESGPVGFIDNLIVRDEEPFCGKASAKNPSFIFYADQTLKPGTDKAIGAFNVKKYNMLCFARRGALKSKIGIYQHWIDVDNRDRHNWQDYTLDLLSENWKFDCFDIGVIVTKSYFYKWRKDNSPLEVKRIKLYRQDNQDILIDNIYIGGGNPRYQRTRLPARPNNILVADVSVQKRGYSFDVTMHPAKCGFNFPLLSIQDAANTTDTTDEAVYTSSSWPAGVTVSVVRQESATPPITGTYDVSLKGSDTSISVPADATAEKLKELLEGNFNVGTLKVSREGTCAGYTWRVEWTSKGGSQPLLQVNGDSLTGNMVDLTHTRSREGQLLMGPIPGEFLRVPHSKHQVEVIINNIPSSCSGKACTFEYSESFTPIVQSGSPATGSVGTNLILSGSGFSNTAADNIVTIGNVDCVVTSSDDKQLTCQVSEAAAGIYEVNLEVKGQGSASYSSGAIIFQYDLEVTSVDPKSGSTAGGTKVTISGKGFGTDVNNLEVSIGSQKCTLQSLTPSEIQCIIALNSEATDTSTNEDVTVTVNGKTETLSGSFTFDPTKTPTINDISPKTSSIEGGNELAITGTGFGATGAAVSIGSANCMVTKQLDTEITCEIPEHGPGSFYVELTITDNGFAKTNGIQFTYELDVTGIFPDHGSLQGGTVVTITGAGFGTNTSDVIVRFGDVECDVTTADDSSLVCVTGSSETTHRVDNTGKHESYGPGYKWNPQVLAITAGDVVAWQWATLDYVENIGYAVQQTEDADSVEYDGKGFYSGSKSEKGFFAYRFSKPGTYYYSSGPVNDDDTLYMKGTIIVSEPKSSSRQVTVKRNGYEALHFSSSGVSAPGSVVTCPGSDAAISGCDTPQPSGEDSQHFHFVYWVCSTPVITNITPNTGDASTSLTIQGTGFSATDCENEVYVGDYSCKIQSSTNGELKCVIDTANSMPVGKPHAVSVVIKNRGRALNQVTSPAKQGFTLKPRIDSLSLNKGSRQGGTKVTITGVGFAAESFSDVSLWIGSRGCLVQSVSYTEIICVTASSSTGRRRRAVNSDIRLEINSQQADCSGDCSFVFSDDVTPQVDGISPGSVSGAKTSMTISGSGFSKEKSACTVTIGGVECVITNADDSKIQCDVSYVPAGTLEVAVNIAGKGNAKFSISQTITSSRDITSVNPTEGSTAGGQLVTIIGNGFVNGDTVVTIDGLSCEIVSVNLYQVQLKSPPHSTGSVNLIVTSSGGSYPAQTYQYSTAATPTVDSVTPNKGKTGDQVTIRGSGFGSVADDIIVTFDGTNCKVDAVASDTILCTLGSHSAGTYLGMVHVNSKGFAAGSAQFEYELKLDSVTPPEGSFGGGQEMTIVGTGFDDPSAVTICNIACPTTSIDSSQIKIVVPPNPGTGDVTCDVSVALASSASATQSGAFTYRTSLTPSITSVDPRRGGTAGGTTLTITGTGFENSGNKVTIGGTLCAVKTETTTEIVCETEAHGHSEMTKVRVEVDTRGIATQENADFFYIDVWSSPYTWGNEDPPVAGESVVIKAGQTILLDTSTPVLTLLLIQGGTLIFDEADVKLHAENIVIVDGGLLQIGTEEEPFQHEATIMMHGHVRSTEIPLFGAKTLAVRNGTLDLHGKPVPMTWTRLAKTANKGDNKMTLEQEVTWKAGDEVVIASTGYRHSQYENEKVTLTNVSPDGTELTFTPPLEYDHLGILQVIEGVALEMRAEVGLLTRNVKVRGYVQREWNEKIEACPRDFDTGQFATQTCFLGKLGEESGSDQFGSQIMLFAAEPDKQLVKGRIEYVEVTHAGQAFRLGRYPIHFHMSGDVNGSYVRGCAIHNTFNRAVTIHGVHNLLVEHNVAYNVMGHAYFLEDGIETGNIIQYNLGIYVRPSSSLLNVDITPATFWVTNPDNIVRHNAAAGGSHFGFWYNMPTHPGGPSFTKSICPRNVPLREFRNNTAHAQGWYGLWIFPTYLPKKGGSCNAWEDEPAKFYSLYAWETERGAEAVEVGAVQFHDFVVSDADKAGVEYQNINAPWGEGGALVKDLVVVAYSKISEAKKEEKCTETGITGPQNDRLNIDGVKFINFDQDRCATLAYCSKCRKDQGGFSVRVQGLEFYNSPNRAAFKWEHECWFVDLDGSLTDKPNHIILPTNPNLPPDACKEQAEYSLGAVGGSTCDDTIRLHRMAFNNPRPSSLIGKEALFTNAHGTSRIPFHEKRTTHRNGWMVTLINGDDYNLAFQDIGHVTNITYDATLYSFGEGDFVLINHEFTQMPDRFGMNGQLKNTTKKFPTYADNQNGDIYFDNDTKTMTYIVSGKGVTTPINRNIHPDIHRCFYKDCLPTAPKPPPVVRPEDSKLWSNLASWENGKLPLDGEDVTILPSVWMVADVQLPVMNKLTIYGGLEIEDSRDNKLEATYILIQGGRLVIGFSEEQPFQHDIKILLNGHHLTPDLPLPDGPNLGSKALGVFGGLDLHGKNRSVYWTQLAATVSPGENTLTVLDETDWMVGDEIVVATTSYEAWQTETFVIEEVLDSSTIQINGSFAFKHIAHFTPDYVLAAEVGLLTRNIKIEGNDYEQLFTESFGARVLVGQFVQDETEYRGYARISNVEFVHSGQEGWSDPYDPRYSLAFLDTGDVTDDAPSSVKGCSFHNGFSPAIGVFGTDGLLLQDNVIHHTVGPAVIVRGEGNQLVHNLVTLVVFPGTYQDRFEEENLDWNGGIEVEKADKVVLVDNTVAGSERVAFKIKGESCSDVANPETDWRGNVGHSTLHGIHMFLISQPECAKIANFLIYKSWDFGVYFQVESNVLMSKLTLVDNKLAVLPLVIGPSALKHQTADLFVRMENSLIVGVSDSFDCQEDAVEPENARQSAPVRGPRAPGKGHAGFIWASFVASHNLAPHMSFIQASDYPTINGVSKLENVAFQDFNEHCGKTDAAIMTNPQSENSQPPLVVTGITLERVEQDQKVYMHRPNLGSVNPSDCVDMDCDGLKKAMIHDLDGSLLGSVGTVIPESEFEWDGDPRRGLGDYRIPKAMLTRQGGSRIPAESKAPNKGIYRGNNNECTYKSDWNAYECHGIDHMMLVIESMDADTEVRRLSPLAMYTDSYVDLINGPMDHGWCNGYTCQERISTFYTLIATGKYYEVYFTSTNPQNTRLHMLNSDETQAVVLGIQYMKPERLDIYYKNRYVIPNNGDFTSGELIWKPKDPNKPANQYNPAVASGVNGENYFERDTQTLWVVIRGPDPVEIRTTAVLMVTFGVPAVSADNFYENDNLLMNLAAVLNIDMSQIRIVDVVREGSRRRKRQASGEAEVILEIGPQPTNVTESPGTEFTTEAPTTKSPGTEVSLEYEDLLDVSAQLANLMQTSSLDFGIAITSMSMVEPSPKPIDPTGGVRATNETGGSSDVPNGTKRYDEVKQEEEENSRAGVEVEYRIPDHLVILTQPGGASTEGAFEQQPSLYVVDALGEIVPQLGSSYNPWQLTVSISKATRTTNMILSGNTTIPFNGRWANFTNLSIVPSMFAVVLEFTITYPSSPGLQPVMSDAFDVVHVSSKRIKLRFLAKYDQVAAGNEDRLAESFVSHVTSTYDGVKLTNVLIERGSILISCDMKGDMDSVLSAMWSDIRSGHFMFEFDGWTLIADSFLLVDDKQYGPTEVSSEGLPGWAIALIVILPIALVGMLLLAYKMITRKGKASAVSDSMLLPEQGGRLQDASGSRRVPKMVIEGIEPPEELFLSDLSAIRSHTNSPRRSPEIEAIALPPGFTESAGQEERVLEDRAEMSVMVKNPDGSFQKLCTVQANKVGTLRDLRMDIEGALPGKLQGKAFVLMYESLKEVEQTQEMTVSLTEVYHSDCVVIKWTEECGETKLCVCGLVGQFVCSLCHQQAYCSPQCQSTDWVQHSMQCSHQVVKAVEDDCSQDHATDHNISYI